MEPDIAHIDLSAGAASISISLKRIADALDALLAMAREELPQNESEKKTSEGNSGA
jgi:hypothetical protein